MPKFDNSPYTQLTAPARGDLQGVIKDISEALPENQTKYAELQDLMKYGAWASKVLTVTATGAVTLLNTDPIFVEINPNGANRDVNFPVKSDDNHGYYVHHTGGANTLTLKRSGGATITTLAAGEIRFIKPSTANDFSAEGGGTDHGALTGLTDDDHPQYVQRGTTIEGMELIWNSGTSLSVGTGVCYAENNDRINITSTLTASSLSLSSNTWYHIYVYLSGGSPAMRVVLTDPVAWKGTAYSRTSLPGERYIGSVKTDGSGNVYNFEHNPITNLVMYRKQHLSASPFRCLSNGTATSATSVSLAEVVPLTGKAAYLSCLNNDTAQTCFIGVAPLTSTAFSVVVSVTQRLHCPFVVMDASQVVYYLYGSAPSSGLHMDVFGYSFKR